MNLVDKALFTDVGGWAPVSHDQSAEWFQLLRSEGHSAINRAAAMLIERLDFLSDRIGFVGPIDEPMIVPGQIGLGTPEMNKDIPNVFFSVCRQLVHGIPAFRFLPTDPDIIDTYMVINTYLSLRQIVSGNLDQDTSEETMLSAIRVACEELERLLREMEGDYMSICDSWFERMDHLVSSIATSDVVSPNMAERLLRIGNEFVLWGARLERELKEAA